MDTEIELNDGQKIALRHLQSGENCLLTGKAGTGKTTVLRAFGERNKNVAFLAPTARAAEPFHGETIHHFFGFKPFEVYSPADLGPLNDKKKIELIRAASVIVIDEASMLRSDLFACIDVRLRQCAPPEAAGLPFGGKQIILVGDWFQLPPIVKENTAFPIWEFLGQFGGKYVHQGKLWRKAKFRVIALRQVMRQNDPEFIALLNQIRYGIRDAAMWGELNRRVVLPEELPESAIHLCPTNDEVQSINNRKINKLPGPAVVFEANIIGIFPKTDYPLDRTLRLYVGERVMFVKNEREGDHFLYKNGTCGTIVSLENDEVCVRTDSGDEVTVKAARFPHFVHSLEKDEQGKLTVMTTEEGAFTQIPLKPAYAITIHKSQGMTLDQAIISPRNCFQAGQLYTALSRCRSLDGIFLTEPIGRVLHDPEIARLYDDWEYSPELLWDTLLRERERFSGLLFGIALPDAEIRYDKNAPLLQQLRAVCRISLLRQRRGEAPESQCALSKRMKFLLGRIRFCAEKLEREGSLDEWEYDKLARGLLEISALAKRAA